MVSQTQRQACMATLAKAELKQLEELVDQLGLLPEYNFLRSPEIGSAMVRSPIEGSGSDFNLGEITITRCVIQIEADQGCIAGFGYVKGRSRRHAELAAVCDGLLQCPSWYKRIETEVIQPLNAAIQRTHELEQRQTSATKVDFFTLVRGEGQ
ncbi:phosphonate C-P lyase system protein PhnG [Plectonema cf. radiosum LEGE 06105]|uniref:Phosphonate C-P lyase system protein PhnG n=1 Tax=Plectonema cf. radiosum LEGE 06105 TaxID=945769 RepID=A0A8J7FI33_9CYAN|nr:phosphonate C-P lyase system protein PhnG [Plectonema radiosum]MBE9214121.1 phosphonate C-P lyase system protein PhnG [Plectonema cf. radiosum LEGE 06105]